MIKLSSAVSVLGVFFLATVARATPPGGGPSIDPAIVANFPAESAALSQGLVSGNDVGAANAALDLVTKAKAAFQGGKTQAAGNSYAAAWRASLSARAQLSDQIQRDKIAKMWQDELGANEAAAKWQIYALVDAWDRSLTSGAFWKLLNTTNDPDALSAACYAIYMRGTESDVRILTNRRGGEHNPKLQAILDAAIDWSNYKQHGAALGFPAPSVLPPVAE
jgi:hypothetical protein